MALQLKMLGKPQIKLEGVWQRLAPDRRTQFLTYLAYSGDWVSRDKLADLFWTNAAPQAARRNLRKIIFKVRELDWVIGFEADEQGARWNVDTDLSGFLEAVGSEAWQEALGLYRGPLLQGLPTDEETEFSTWLELERVRLEELEKEARQHYAEQLEEEGDFDTALSVVRAALERDPLDEQSHRTVMRLEYRQGDTEAAFEQFERCRERLQQDLGVEPLPETLELLKSFEPVGQSQAKRALLISSSESIPERPKKLIGRDDLLEEVPRLLVGGRRVLIHGFGGMGKTALTAELAGQHLEATDGAVIWLQAGSDDPDSLFDALAHPFEAQQAIVKATDKTSALREILAKSDVSLIVLDDVWNAYSLSKVADAVPKDLPLLVTSRQRYPRFERVYTDRLERSAALELLSLHAGQSLADEAANKLCDLLGDHAFALRIAGLTLRETATMPEALIAQIKNAPHDLKVPNAFAEEGSRSVAALLNASLEPLGDLEYEAFLAYGALFIPSATPEFLARCLRRDVNGVENALFTLVQRGLAERVSKPGSDLISYRIHDLAHSYAHANRFHRSGTIIQSGLEYLREHKDEVAVLEPEIANLLGAAQACQELGKDKELVDYMYLLTVEGAYFTARGHSSRSLELLKTAVALSKAMKRTEPAHYLATKLGEQYFNFIGDNEAALGYYEQALSLAKQMANQERETILLGLIGIVKFHRKEEDASNFLDRAYELAKSNGTDESLCRILDQRGYVAAAKEHWAEANKLFRESLEVIGRLENNTAHSLVDIERSKFFILLNLGETELKLGHFEQGLAARRCALDIAKKRHNQIWQAIAMMETGKMYHHIKNYDLAKEFLQMAFDLFRVNQATNYIDELLPFLAKEGYRVAELT